MVTFTVCSNGYMPFGSSLDIVTLQICLLQVQSLSQFLLLQTAADDAIVRLQNTSFSQTEVERVLSIYYEYQHHNSLEEFLENECKNDHERLMQVLN